MEVNGDTFVIKSGSGSVLLGVIDGLGHGPAAHIAAETARQFVESHFDQSLPAIFLGVDRACRTTRGVVMALARFDFGVNSFSPSSSSKSLPEIKLTFASIGDVEARVFGNPGPVNFMIRRGVLGGGAPNAVATEHSWDSRSILVLHSDGLSSHWQWQDYPGIANLPAILISQQLLLKLAKEDDDATIIVIKAKDGIGSNGK
jgi:serine/threonine protein phosphatase PrpC